MKIMVQNRTMIIEQPRCVWVEHQKELGGRYVIASNVRRAPVLGEYDTYKRSVEVLDEIFSAQRNGKINYYMPQE